jgi:hypothetical protein
MIEESSQKDKDVVKDMVWLLYDTSALASGFSLEEPASFAKRIHKIISVGMGACSHLPPPSPPLPPLSHAHTAHALAHAPPLLQTSPSPPRPRRRTTRRPR